MPRCRAESRVMVSSPSNMRSSVRRELDVERSNRFGSSAFSGRGDLPLSYQDRVWSTLVSGRRFSMRQILRDVDRELALRPMFRFEQTLGESEQHRESKSPEALL